ncbi:MAG: TOBE domain-containing protein [Deltaproteobacteria bacterium]|nr:TOBE domain-containing protein [Deltaproteobacteria bacterium]
MNEGEILQIGSPKEVYSQPKNLFAAQFVGEMNFIRGRLCGDGQVESPFGKLRCALPQGCQSGHEVTLAIRPEHLTLRPCAAGSGGIEAKVSSKNYLGDAALLEVEACGVNLRGKLAGDADFAVGEKAVLVLPADRWSVYA